MSNYFINGRDTKQLKNLPWMIEQEAHCHNCKKTVMVVVEKGQKDIPTVICPQCRKSETGDIWMDRERMDKDITAMLHRFLPGGTPSRCKIYRPGDRGFKTRAAQCTPILDIAS